MIGKLLCWLGVHKWTGDYWLPELSGIQMRHCARCNLHRAWPINLNPNED